MLANSDDDDDDDQGTSTSLSSGSDTEARGSNKEVAGRKPKKSSFKGRLWRQMPLVTQFPVSFLTCLTTYIRALVNSVC